jgi:hypothetical protein
MKNLDNFQSFVGESSSNEFSPQDIVNYITAITPDESDVPDFFFKQIKSSGKHFTLKRVKIEDLLKADPSLKEYVDSGEERYGENGESDFEPDPDDLDNPIVVFNGEVVDGYNRVSVHHRMGEEYIAAYVSN